MLGGATLLAALALAAENPLIELGSFNGNVRVVVAGNTMATPYIPNPANFPPDPNLPDGLGCVLSHNSATFAPLPLSSRAKVVKAYLYFSGNYFQKGSSPGPLSADVRTLVDRSVSLTLPGAVAPATVIAPLADVHIASFADGLLSPQRTSYFYSARADITDLVAANQTFIGTYTLSDFSTLICPEEEKTCVDGADTQPQCTTPYYVATASFVVVLVFSDPAFTPRLTALFDGLQILDADNPEQRLTLSGVTVPSIPRGTVSMYTIEGDVHQFGDSAAVDAGRGEVALGKVVASAPTPPIFCGDASLPNWQNNLMDSSIVLDPTAPETSSCVRGVDVDTFDISNVLQPNDHGVDVLVRTTGTDKFAVAFAALGIDNFQPILNADTRKEAVGVGPSGVEPKTTLTYRIGISNTGNIAATGVRVTDDLPAHVSELKILRVPEGATDNSTASGGLNQTGRIDVSGVAVEPGEIAEIRYQLTVTCPVNDRAVLSNSAVISQSLEGAQGLVVGAAPVTVTDPGGDICAGRRAPGPIASPPFVLNRLLRGGAGCTAIMPAAPWFAGAILWAWRRRKRRVLLVLPLLALGDCTCQRALPQVIPTPSASAPQPTAPEPPEVFPGVACPGHTDMVRLAEDGACIDRFEQVVAEGASPREGYGEVPTGGFSFTTAQATCASVAKRLCTAAEWERGCRGAGARLYPYGDSFDGARCNGFDADWNMPLESGAMSTCLSDLGVFDMSGNLSEWIDAEAPYVGGTGKQLRGGSFVGNLSGLSCTAIVPRAPDSVDAKAGVRCCVTP